jgi:hypothetical protein
VSDIFLVGSFYGTDQGMQHSLLLFFPFFSLSILDSPIITHIHKHIPIHIYIYVYICTYTLGLDSIYEKNMQPLSFWTWLISHNIMLYSSIHLSWSDIIYFFFMAESYSMVYNNMTFLFISWSAHRLIALHECCK